MDPGSAIIIGAGPAGCSAAIHLANRSWTVTLVEAKAFPRVKVCGEFISPAATDDLESLIDAQTLRQSGAVRIHEFILDCHKYNTTWPLPSPAWALSRATLDTLLIQRARAAGATIIQPVRVASASVTPDSVTVDLSNHSTRRADILIHADGSGRLDDAGPAPMAPNLVGAKCHLRSATIPNGVRIRAARGAYIGTIMVEHGLATCALCATKSIVRAYAGNFDALLADVLPGFDPADRQGPWLASGIARSPFTPSPHTRSFRIGNAAGAVDPVGGEGIGLGLWAGRSLAETLDSCTSLDSAKAEYARRYTHRLRFRRPACRLAAETLMRPKLVHLIRPALAVPALTIAPWYAMTGKPGKPSHHLA